MIIDEIQKVPTLLDEIKKVIDQEKLKWLKNDEPHQLMYILTGSNRFELQQGISDSLAGRCAVVEMSSFTNLEKNGIKEKRDISHRLICYHDTCERHLLRRVPSKWHLFFKPATSDERRRLPLYFGLSDYRILRYAM